MELINGQYEIGGVSALEIVREFGDPVYVYNTETIRKRYEELTSAFSDIDMKVKYACKALTNLAVLKYIRSLGSDLDAVSIQEVHLALKAGFQPQQILFTPNCVDFEEVKAAIDLGVQVNIDNISILEHFGDCYGGDVPVCVRINPHIMAGGNKNISVGHIDSKFGISLHQMRHLERVINYHNIKVVGLHMHTGSDILDADVFLRGAEILFDLAASFPDLQFLDFGSGFKVAYREGDNTTDVQELGRKLSARFQEFCQSYGRDLELWFEPGKFLVSEAGFFLTRVNVVKTTPASVFVGLNTGMNHLIRPMFYNASHRIVNISNPEGVPRVYSVVGYICETDNFAIDDKLNEVREGDILAFYNAGAYGMMMASNYNSRLRPPEVLIHKGQAHLIRRRETIDDLVRTQIDVEL